jgi:hypothetical protein
VLYPGAEEFSRVPPGHPEGYFEAFANVYKSFISFLAVKKLGAEPLAVDLDFPRADQGVAGVTFIEKCVESSNNNSVWIDMD